MSGKRKRIDRIDTKGNIREHAIATSGRPAMTLCGLAIGDYQEASGNARCRNCERMELARLAKCSTGGLTDRLNFAGIAKRATDRMLAEAPRTGSAQPLTFTEQHVTLVMDLCSGPIGPCSVNTGRAYVERLEELTSRGFCTAHRASIGELTEVATYTITDAGRRLLEV